jgi:PBSX family phage terminase large subunit
VVSWRKRVAKKFSEKFQLREPEQRPRFHIDILYDPHEKQSEFHLSRALYRLFVGGKGSGKTKAGAADVIRYSICYPNNLILVGRATYPELRDTTRKEVLEFPVRVDGREYRFGSSPWVKSFNRTENTLTLINGSTIIFRALDDVEKIKSLNLGGFWFDELTETPEEMWLAALGQLRRPLPLMIDGVQYDGSVFAIGTTNPEGHDWVWKRWVMAPDEKHFYVQATSYDNPYVSRTFIDEMRAQYPEEWVKRYVLGSFDTFSGLVYNEFQDRKPHVVGVADIPDDWYRFVALDYGYRNPTAVLWCAISPKGRVFVYDEFYASGKLVSETAEIIQAKSRGQKIQQWLIDPSAGNRQGTTGLSVIDEFAKYGLYMRPANNDVRAGINRVKEKMRVVENESNLVIFSTCVNLRTELQTYRWKDLKPGAVQDAPDKPVKKGDHAADALRYAIAYIYDTPELKSEPKTWRDYSILKRLRGDSKDAELPSYMAA